MAGNSLTQASFAAGELTPSLYGRVDFAKYYNGLRTCRNFIVRSTGGVSNRPGTRFVGKAIDSTVKGRLIPFQFSTDQSYVLEFGECTMRVISNGAYVEYPPSAASAAQTVTGLAYAVIHGRMMISPTTLTIPSHGLHNGQMVTIAGVATGLDGTLPIVYIDENTIGFYIGGSSLGVWTGAGTVTPAAVPAGVLVEVSSPYHAMDLHKVKYTQCNDVVTLVHPDYPPQQLSRYSDTDWRWSDFVTTGGPFQDINTDTTKTMIASGSEGQVTITALFDGAFSPDMEGTLLYLEQSPDASTVKWEVQKPIAINEINTAGVNFYIATAAGNTGTVTPTHTDGVQNDGNPGIPWRYLHSGFGIVRLNTFIDDRNMAATVVGQLPDLCVSGMTHKSITNVTMAGFFNLKVECYGHGFIDKSYQTISGVTGIPCDGTFKITVVDVNNFLIPLVGVGIYAGGGIITSTTAIAPTYKWAKAAWGGNQGYPATVSYYQQREIFAGTKGRPQTTNLSTTGGYNDFSQSFPLLDNDAITFTLASREQNEIRHIIELNKLLMLTSAGEWIIQGSNDVLTPASVNVRRQGYSGCAHVAPLVIDSQAIYVQEKGNQIRSLGYNWQSDAYTGQELSVMSRHLFDGHQIVAWAYQRVPFGAVWAIRDDGVLLVLSYLPEHDVTGWSRHDTDGYYEDVCCISEGTEDAVYLTVKRTIGGVDHRYVEKVANRLFTDIKDAFFVDCGLSFHATDIDPVTHLPYGPRSRFHGLDHLEGKTVSILADGATCDPQVVTGGAITIPRAASIVHAGLGYVSEMCTLDLASPQQEIKDKFKLSPQISVICVQTSCLKAGPDMDHMTEQKQNQADAFGAPADMLEGTISMQIQNTWNKPGRITIAQTEPLPMTILAVIPAITFGGV